MSKYTMQLRWVIESLTANEPGLTIKERILKACPLIFDFDFPIFDEAHRLALEKKILMHYCNREIGVETYGLWKFYLDEKLNLIMPAYNVMYQYAVDISKLIGNVDYTEIATAKFTEEEKAIFSGQNSSTGNNTLDSTVKDTGDTTLLDTGTQTTQSTGSGTNKNLTSDLPQINYANVDYGTSMDEGETSSTSNDTRTDNLTHKTTLNTQSTNTSTNDSTNESTSNSTNTVNRDKDNSSSKTINGRMGGETIAKTLMEYRQSILNIDNMIINDLAELFMLIY